METAAMEEDITKNSNREYGLKIAALFSLRCVFQENYDEKFWITFNVGGVVPFGNIILYQGSMMYILRIKYEDDPKDIKEKEFLAPTGDFSLIKSFYDNVNLDMNLKSEKFKSDEIENIKILFFTNGNVISDKTFIWKEVEEGNIPSFLKLDLFKFKTSDRTDKFYLCNESLSMEEMDLEIRREWKRIIKHSEIGIDKVTTQSLNFFKDNFESNRCLTKQNIFDKITEILLNDYRVNFKENDKLDFNFDAINLWKNMSKDKNITIIEDYDEDIIKFLLNYIYLETEKNCNANSKCKQSPLLLKINNLQDFLHIQQVLRVSNYPYKAIILASKLTLTKKDDLNTVFKTLKDLNEEKQKEILKLSVKLQGRLSVSLRDLVNEDMFEFIKCSDIIKILLGTLNVGNELKFLTGNLIKRSTTKIFIKMNVLDEVRKERFLIEDSQNILNINYLRKNIFISNREIDFKQETKNWYWFQPPIHYLSVYNDIYLEWKDSVGSVEKIRNFQVNLQSEADILDHLSKRVTLINGEPGMGKSTMVDYVANKANINKLIFKINLNEHQSYFENRGNLYKNAVEHVRYFVNLHKCRDNHLTEAIYENFIAKRDVILLLDGFDEIAVCYMKEVAEFAKCLYDEDFSIWITSRPVMKSYLEERFNTFCVDLIPFTTNDKKEYLINYYSNNNIMVANEFVDGLLNLCEKHLNDDLTTIPLYSKLVAEGFLNDYKHSSGGLIELANEFNLLYLYKSFIENKLNVLCAKCENDDKIREHQSRFALKLLFPLHHHLIDIDKELDYYRSDPHKIQLLQREGVITINEKLEINFIHRTFAEYLAADWLSRNIHDEKAKILITERFSGDYKFLFYIFDLLLAEKCPLHLAIINNNLDEIQKCLNLYSVDTTDKGGRSVVHMLCLYSVQFPIMYHNYGNRFRSKASDTFLNSKLYLEDGMLNIIEQIPDYQVMDIKKDLFGYNPLDYALANNALTAAEKIHEKSKTATININIKLDLKDNYRGYCAALNYTSLFGFLLTHFTSRDVLLKNLDGNMDTETYYRQRYCFTASSKPMTVLNLLQSKCAFSGYIDERYTDLRYAVIFDSKDNVEKLLEEGADIHKWDHDNNTPLHYAALYGCLENAKLLLSKGANVNKQNYADDTPLHLALRENHIEIAKILLANGANGNVANKRGETSLHYAIQKNYLGIFETIVSKNGINNNQNIDGNTPFHLALKKGQLDIAEILLSSGSNGNLQNMKGETPLHYAIENSYNDIARKIILNGFANNKRNLFGSTPLHLTLMKCERDIAKLLISNGVDVNVENKENEIALHWAAQNDLNHILEMIISDSKINRRNIRGDTPLHLALMKRSLSAAEMVISRGASIKFENKEQQTELVSKVITKDLIDKKNILSLNYCTSKEKLIELFISYGADLNISGFRDNTILHILSEKGYDKIVEKVLLSSVGNSKQNDYGNTPLHLALLKRYIKVAELLISNGADVNIVNKHKETPFCAAINKANRLCQTPLYLAIENNFFEFVPKLISKENINIKQRKNGNTALHMALLKNNKDVINLLIENGADINIGSKHGQTVFHLAVKRGDLDVVAKLLKKCKVEINKPNKNGNTALHLASQNGSEDILNILLLHKIDVTLKNKRNETALDLAEKIRNEKIVSIIGDYIKNNAL